MFGALIGNPGFNSEDLALEGKHKVDLMFGVLNVLYLMAIQKGIVEIEQEAQEMKVFYDPQTS